MKACKTGVLLMIWMTNIALLATLANAQQEARAKRVWTNDDFAPTPAAITNPGTETQAVPTDKTEGTAKTLAADPEFKDQEEAPDEMLATARLRQKAYDQAIERVQHKLEAETNEFRVEVYKKILNDTRVLQESNKAALEQLKEQQTPASPRQGPGSDQ